MISFRHLAFLPFFAAPLVFAASPSTAQTLTVYTYDSFVSEWGPGPQLETLFEAECQCDVNFVGSADGIGMLNRIRLEGKTTSADVILGLDNLILEQARREHLVQPHGVDLSPISANLHWNDADFVPFDYGYFAWIYDTTRITTPATSFEALIDSKARIIYQDPRTSTPGFGLMVWLNTLYGDNATEKWQQLAKQTETVSQGWWEAYSLFLEGGADYVLSYTTSPAYHVLAESDNRYAAATFDAGHIAQIEVAAISATSKNVSLAASFLEFLLSPAAQTVIPTTNWMLPVIDNVALDAAFDHAMPKKTLSVDTLWVQENKNGWTRAWRSAVAQ